MAGENREKDLVSELRLVSEEEAERMPVLFIGHGNSMNAISDNAFTLSLKHLGRELPRPSSILIVSAHWLTRGTFVICTQRPKTIHGPAAKQNPTLWQYNYSLVIYIVMNEKTERSMMIDSIKQKIVIGWFFSLPARFMESICRPALFQEISRSLRSLLKSDGLSVPFRNPEDRCTLVLALRRGF